MIYACCDEIRRAAVLGNPTLNGIDYLEVMDSEEADQSLRQRTLLVHCLKPAPTKLAPSNVLIEGGESVIGIVAQWLAPATTPPPQASAQEVAYFATIANPANVIVIRVDKAGDFSPYTLRLVDDAETAAADSFGVTEALVGFDPQLAEVGFSFKVECPPDFDCAPSPEVCASDGPPPTINYLAKDYGSFRTLLLDRLRQLAPTWQGASEADIGIVLTELIAYVGDELSYRQDAVATEAYLRTARSRISLRRHARLVDYRIWEGCNARTFVAVQVSSPMTLDKSATRFATFAPGMPLTLAIGAETEDAALAAGVVVFEPVQDANLLPEHNRMRFYTWGEDDCCLPRGATEATLLGSYPRLQIGDILIFEEAIGPQTGVSEDADIRHRCAVRLTAVATQDGRGHLLVDPLFEAGTGAPIISGAQTPTPVTEIQWSSDDALPFPVCISSSFRDATGKVQGVRDVSIVLGNVVLADQGLTMPPVALPPVPKPILFQAPSNADRCDPASPTPFPVFYRPRLPSAPLTFAYPIATAGVPVTSAPVALTASGRVSLKDSNGLVCLMAKADSPWNWPNLFGVLVAPNGASFDLSIVYVGSVSPVVLERFAGLTLAGGASNNALTKVNGVSRFITLSAPSGSPNAFPSVPTKLSTLGPVALQDSGGAVYLEAAALNPSSWPPLFELLAQGDLAQPSRFNLLVLFQPPSAALGVAVPVVVEEFDGIALDNVQIAFASKLVDVLSFETSASPDLSALDLMRTDARGALPAIALSATRNGVAATWTARTDLLASGAEDHDFVVEVDTDGFAQLRFGDGVNGLAPDTGTAFTATFRIGNGAAGNIGAKSLKIFAGDPRIVSCANPLAASGGVDPETADQIRRRAPVAFETQERAVTMADYAAAVESASGQVQGAAATLRWTGSWLTAFVAAEPKGGGEIRKPLRRSIDRVLERYRLAGQDYELESPDYVALDIVLDVCVESDYFLRDVEKALLKYLTEGDPANGQAPIFAPGSFGLGETVYLSPITTAARGVAGVCSVSAAVFQPQGVATTAYLDNGEIPIGAFQAARLDNDPSFPNHGQLRLMMAGGK